MLLLQSIYGVTGLLRWYRKYSYPCSFHRRLFGLKTLPPSLHIPLKIPVFGLHNFFWFFFPFQTPFPLEFPVTLHRMGVDISGTTHCTLCKRTLSALKSNSSECPSKMASAGRRSIKCFWTSGRVVVTFPSISSVIPLNLQYRKSRDMLILSPPKLCCSFVLTVWKQ